MSESRGHPLATARSRRRRAELLGLRHLCTVDLVLGRPVMVGDGPNGQRMIVDIESMTLSGERLTASLRGRTAADWVTVAAGIATIDVRATVETADGALIFVRYGGRSDATNGIGSAPIHVAPVFETSDARYGWPNAVQAIGKGSLRALRYEWFEPY